jgi:hypothetical protein
MNAPGAGDRVTQELLLKIEAQLPNVAVSSFGLRDLRAHLTLQLSEAKELLSKFPDSFLHSRVPAVSTESGAHSETTRNDES